MTHALVTGASGFIGTHLVAQLHQAGQQVTCLLRDHSDRSRLNAYQPRFLVGDVTDADSLRHALKRVDVVYHLAGVTKCLNTEQFERVNVDGVRNVAKAIANCPNPPTLLLASSLAAAGPTHNGRLRVETDTPSPVSNYGHSKLAGEYVAMHYAANFPLTIIRPPIVLGEADRDGLSMFEGIARWGVHLVPGLTDELFSVIHADDLAAAMILAAEKGQRTASAAEAGRGIYFAAADETPTYAELGRMIGRSLGQNHIRVIRNPKAAVWCIASINELISQIRQHPHILNLDKAREATAGSWACSAHALQRDTGFAPAQPLQSRLDQTAEWYIEAGWLKTVAGTWPTQNSHAPRELAASAHGK